MKVLVVEDEQRIAQFLRKGLTEKGYAVEAVGDADAALDKIVAGAPDVIILDLMLDGSRDGLELCRELRTRGVRAKILMLTARDTIENKIEGLDAGADDYLVKPFSFRELMARLRALLRRSAGHSAPSLECGALRLDPRAARASVNGEPLRLTSLEYRLLHYMMMHQGRVISRTELVEHLYDQDFDRDSNTIEVFVGRVRKKIGPDRIETARGLGYRLVCPPGEEAGQPAAS